MSQSDRVLAVTLLALVPGGATTLAAATPRVPPGFQITFFDNTMLSPKGILCPPHRAGAGTALALYASALPGRAKFGTVHEEIQTGITHDQQNTFKMETVGGTGRV